MKKMVLALTLAALALSGTASAQYWQDNIGMYFDEGATISCDSRPFGFYNAFVVLTNLTSPSIGGWEAKITMVGGGQITSVTPRPALAHINAATRMNEYIIGLGEPMFAVGGRCVIADVTLVVANATVPTYGFIGPVYYDSLENGLPAYLDGQDSGLIKPLLPRIGEVTDPQFIINGDCAVDNEDASFGAVKALFR
jgi:hypothetical protein